MFWLVFGVFGVFCSGLRICLMVLRAVLILVFVLLCFFSEFVQCRLCFVLISFFLCCETKQDIYIYILY